MAFLTLSRIFFAAWQASKGIGIFNAANNETITR
jgi:hypothetical protein